jgi:competence protein ComGF
MSYKAFTLTETVFGLIISSVLIAVIYTVFTAFNKQFAMFQQQQINTNDYMLFETTFHQDLYTAVAVSYSEETLSLERYDETVIRYVLKDHVIERQQKEHSEILYPTLLSHKVLDNETHLEIALQVQLHGDTIQLKYYKQQTPHQLLNSTFIDEIRR